MINCDNRTSKFTSCGGVDMLKVGRDSVVNNFGGRDKKSLKTPDLSDCFSRDGDGDVEGHTYGFKAFLCSKESQEKEHFLFIIA